MKTISLSLTPLIDSFFQYTVASNIELYNEFSLQHELGIFLRKALPNYKVQFERNVSFFFAGATTTKKEIDIALFDDSQSEKYAIELKCPLNGQYPEQMYSFVKDIRFMEQLKELDFSHTYCVALVADRPFYTGRNTVGIYKHFREDYRINGRFFKPTGEKKDVEYIDIVGDYPFSWKDIGDQRKYYCIEI